MGAGVGVGVEDLDDHPGQRRGYAGGREPNEAYRVLPSDTSGRPVRGFTRTSRLRLCPLRPSTCPSCTARCWSYAAAYRHPRRHAARVSRSRHHEQGIRQSRHDHAERQSAGDACLVQLRRQVHARQLGAGTGQGQEHAPRSARCAFDPRPRQSVPLPRDPGPSRRDHRRRRGRAHQRAREEVPGDGDLPQPQPRRSAGDLRHRAPAGGGARVNRAPVQQAPRLFALCRLIQRTTIWASIILLALVALSADMARAAGSKCTAAKYNAAGQRAADKAKCFGKAVKKGGGVDSACLSNAEGMFSSLFTKAESHADCLAPKGDAGTVASTVDAFVEDITRTVTGSTGGAFVASKCNSKKIEAVVTKVAAKAKCESKAARKGTAVAPRCLANADGKFGHAIGKAEGKDDCAQKGQRVTLEAKVDAFMDALMSQLQPMGTVTTTTTRTARTTTTTASTPRICCHFASGGTCDWAPSANACSGNEVPGTPGASGSVCNGATGTCTSPPASAGPCCSGVASFSSNACSGGPGETASVCSAEGGTLSTGVCHPSGACVP